MNNILTEREWAVLFEMALSLYRNAERDEYGGWWTVGDTMIDEEVELLEKLSKFCPTKVRGLYLKETGK